MPATVTHATTATSADQPGVEINKAQWNGTAAHIVTVSVVESELNLTDVSTGNVSTAAHGFAPKVTNTANFLKGDGTWAAPAANSGPTYPGVIPLTGVKYPQALNMNVSTGDTDIYTVPGGKRAMIRGVSVFNNSGVGNIIWYLEIKISGTYYRLVSNATTANAQNASQGTISFVAEAGEIVAINTATNNGLSVLYDIVEFDATCKVYSPRLLTLAAGDNILYTVPASTTASILTANFIFPGFGAGAYVNTSGGARTITWKVTPSGGATTQITVPAAPANNARSTIGICGALGAADAIVINTDANTATQIAFISVMEI